MENQRKDKSSAAAYIIAGILLCFVFGLVGYIIGTAKTDIEKQDAELAEPTPEATAAPTEKIEKVNPFLEESVPSEKKNPFLEDSAPNEKINPLTGKPMGSSTKVTPFTEQYSQAQSTLTTRPLSGQIIFGKYALNRYSTLDISVGDGGDYYVCFVFDNPLPVTNGSALAALHNGKNGNLFAFYVRNGSTISKRIPAGNAKLYYAVGDEWQNPTKLFGSSTSCYMSDDEFDFTNYDYTLALYPVANGNFETDGISVEDFPA